MSQFPACVPPTTVVSISLIANLEGLTLTECPLVPSLLKPAAAQRCW